MKKGEAELREPYRYVDELGRLVTRYPPGWAEGSTPGASAKPRGGAEEEE